ncbi:glycoside hydrolase family 95-like protein, partial [Acidobacteriota bacterium]
PKFAEASKVVLEQRGLSGNGWASAWKMACWARLLNPDQAMANFHYYIHNYTFQNLFGICSRALQVDGMFGVSAAVAEMILQSHEGFVHLLPAIPPSWSTGRVIGVRARGGFELDLEWDEGQLKNVRILSLSGNPLVVRHGHHEVRVETNPGETLVFDGNLKIQTPER